MKEVNPCRGCVCFGCAKSEQNGNTYGCKEKRCKNCQSDDRISKLHYCENVIELEEREGFSRYE